MNCYLMDNNKNIIESTVYNWKFFWRLNIACENKESRISRQLFFGLISIQLLLLNFIPRNVATILFILHKKLYCKIVLFSLSLSLSRPSMLFIKFQNINDLFCIFLFFSSLFSFSFHLQHSICIQIALNVKLMRFFRWGTRTVDGLNRTMTAAAQIFGC